MKPDRTYSIIVISSIALFIVLIIQVNWILETARVHEEMFNDKATMVLSKTADALNADKQTRKKINDTDIGPVEIQKIDSLLKYYMRFYNFQIGYYFEVNPGTTIYGTDISSHGNSCKQNLDPTGKANGPVLKMVFPDKEDFIIAEMGVLFLTSIFLILIVIVLFWRTVISLMKEKKLSEHTTDFLNNMTHEFKTPLTNIGLAGKMILKEPVINNEEKVKYYSDIILKENEKLRQQVEHVLSMTALEKGEIPIQKTELDLQQLVLDAIKPMIIQVENKQGRIITKPGAEKSMILGDKTHLSNAICNLVDNAIKYSSSAPEILIRTWNDDHLIILEISDNGIGIDQKHYQRVFEKFFRVPTGDIHDVKGFGLGLAYVKKIVELHGGTIEIYSEKEKGSTFTIKFEYA